MSQLFAFVVAAAIRPTILLLAAAGVAVLLRNRAAAVRHALWTAAIAASLSLPLLGAILPNVGVRNPFSVSGFASATWSRIVGPALPPNVNVPSETSATAKETAPASRALFDIGEIFASAPSGASPAAQIREVLILVWLAGVILGLSRILRSSVAVIRLRRSATTVSDARIVAVWRQLEQRLASRNVLLVDADSVTAPGTAGIIRPTIFLPRGAAEWGAIRIRATLAHECAHVGRCDCLTQLLADTAVALYWFNPLVWYARRRMIAESERACDDQVIRDGVRPERYASVLVETVRASLLQRKGQPAGVLSMARPSELETRLVSILDPSRSRGRVSWRVTIATASATIVVAVLISAPHLDAASIEVAPIDAAPIDAVSIDDGPTDAAPTRSAPAEAAPADPQTRPRVIGAEPAAQLPSLQVPAGEPDRRRDSIASPLSERVALSAEIKSAAMNTAALRGPDSVLARELYAQLSRSPTWEGDLVRDRSTWALSRQQGGLLVDPLIESLTDRDWRIRAYAAWALAESGASRAVPALVALLSDPNWRMRAMAGYALVAIGDQRAGAAMATAIADEAWQVRVSAVHFLGELHNPKYQPLLETALADRHVSVRQAAAEALGVTTIQR